MMCCARSAPADRDKNKRRNMYFIAVRGFERSKVMELIVSRKYISGVFYGLFGFSGSFRSFFLVL